MLRNARGARRPNSACALHRNRTKFVTHSRDFSRNFAQGLKQKDPVRSPLIYSIDPRPPRNQCWHSLFMMFYVVFNIFSLSTRHCSRWISCICQHLKIVWETSKTDPFSLGKIIRHTFALHAARKMKKCDHFGGSSTPFPPRVNVGPCDYDRIYASVST